MRKKLRLSGCDREPGTRDEDYPKSLDQKSPSVYKVRKSSHDLTVEAVILLLQEKWPGCFSIHERNRRPLKVGIFTDIVKELDGAVTHVELTTALRCYTANRQYLKKILTGADRIGEDRSGRLLQASEPPDTRRDRA
jgi:hypothetical protein